MPNVTAAVVLVVVVVVATMTVGGVVGDIPFGQSITLAPVPTGTVDILVISSDGASVFYPFRSTVANFWQATCDNDAGVCTFLNRLGRAEPQTLYTAFAMDGAGRALMQWSLTVSACPFLVASNIPCMTPMRWAEAAYDATPPWLLIVGLVLILAAAGVASMVRLARTHIAIRLAVCGALAACAVAVLWTGVQPVGSSNDAHEHTAAALRLGVQLDQGLASSRSQLATAAEQLATIESQLQVVQQRIEARQADLTAATTARDATVALVSQASAQLLLAASSSSQQLVAPVLQQMATAASPRRAEVLVSRAAQLADILQLQSMWAALGLRVGALAALAAELNVDVTSVEVPAPAASSSLLPVNNTVVDPPSSVDLGLDCGQYYCAQCVAAVAPNCTFSSVTAIVAPAQPMMFQREEGGALCSFSWVFSDGATIPAAVPSAYLMRPATYSAYQLASVVGAASVMLTCARSSGGQCPIAGDPQLVVSCGDDNTVRVPVFGPVSTSTMYLDLL